MGINLEYRAYTLLGIASKFQDFFNSEPKNVEIKYKDKDGNIQTKTIPNVALMKQQLNDHGITSDDLDNILQQYGKLGENLVFGYGKPDESIFNNNENVLYIDRNTATIYGKNSLGVITSNFNSIELDKKLEDYIMFNRDIVIGEGDPTAFVNEKAKLYIDTTNNTLYVRDRKGDIASVSKILQTKPPVVSGPSSILETDIGVFTIENFDKNRQTSYNIKATAGKVNRVNDKIYLTPPVIGSDLNIKIYIVATDANLLPSDQIELNLTITNVPDTADQFLVNNNYPSNEVINDGWLY